MTPAADFRIGAARFFSRPLVTDGAVAGPWISSSQGVTRGRCTTIIPSLRKSLSYMVRTAHPTYKQPFTYVRG